MKIKLYWNMVKISKIFLNLMSLSMKNLINLKQNLLKDQLKIYKL